MYVPQQIQWPFQGNLKLHQQHFPQIAGNASMAFPSSLLSASASLSNHFFKTPSSFVGDPPVPLPPPPKTPVMARKIVEIVIERAVKIENMVIPCSQNKVQIISTNDVFLSRIFSRVCLILATCGCQFCGSISSLACFLVFKSSSLSLYNCRCSSE